MPKPYPPEFRRRALDLVSSGRTLVEVAKMLGITESCLYRGGRRSSTGTHPQRFSTISYVRSTKQALQRPVEPRQFTSWTFTDRARRAGLVPSLGSVGDPYDNAVIEAFWGRMQTELLYRRRWNTRVELANAILEYIEGFHNRRRRHSPLRG